MTTTVVFDLDGTLLDSDTALMAAFVALGVEREHITFGHVIADECARLGLVLADYLDAYDPNSSQPFAGVSEMLAALPRWAVCSNKHPRSGTAELDRLGWNPEVALFADAFDGPKALTPVLDALSVSADEIIYVGDTDHDRAIAAVVGCRFVLAGWNPRALPVAGDEVATDPGEILLAVEGQLLGSVSSSDSATASGSGVASDSA